MRRPGLAVLNLHDLIHTSPGLPCAVQLAARSSLSNLVTRTYIVSSVSHSNLLIAASIALLEDARGSTHISSPAYGGSYTLLPQRASYDALRPAGQLWPLVQPHASSPYDGGYRAAQAGELCTVDMLRPINIHVSRPCKSLLPLHPGTFSSIIPSARGPCSIRSLPASKLRLHHHSFYFLRVYRVGKMRVVDAVTCHLSCVTIGAFHEVWQVQRADAQKVIWKSADPYSIPCIEHHGVRRLVV